MAYKYPYDFEEQVKYEPPKFKTNRSMWKFLLLSILTLGIYSIVFFTPFANELDKIHPKRDGTKTMDFLLVYILSLFTFSFVMYIWYHHISQRIEEALLRRKINYNFGTNDFWTWYIVGSLILVGPFIYIHKLCTAMNLLCESYNETPDINAIK